MEKLNHIEEQKRIEEQKSARTLLNQLNDGRGKSYGDRQGEEADEIFQELNAGDIFSRWQVESDDSMGLRDDIDDLADAPECKRTECYNCMKGKCVALEDNDFGHRECPFFVPSEQVREKQKLCLRRLLDEGREDLIEQYGDQLAALGIVDLGDVGLEQMFSGLLTIEQELSKKAEAAKERRKQVDPDAEDYDYFDDAENSGDSSGPILPVDYDAIWAWEEAVDPFGAPVGSAKPKPTNYFSRR